MAETKRQIAQRERRYAKADRIMLTLGAIFVVSFFGWLAYQSKDSPSTSLDLQHVSPEILERAHSPSQGPANAKVTIVEFTDLACHSCQHGFSAIETLREEYGGDLKIVYRYLSLHQNSLFAAAVLEEARMQGKFDEAIEVLFHRQKTWASKTDPKPEAIRDLVSEVGVDISKTSAEELIQKHLKNIEADELDAKTIGVTKTPTFFINGRILMTENYEILKSNIDEALKVAAVKR